MPFAITASCCADATCVSVCPVDCIHPTPAEPDFGTTDILYVDPKVCIDCGACADACPVDAVKPIDLLRGGEEVFARLNAEFYEQRQVPERVEPVAGAPVERVLANPVFADVGHVTDEPLRIAIVGTGPAASYAARHLLTTTDATVTMIDRLPVPGGLVRAGVAPDHPSTKRFGGQFEWVHTHPRAEMFMNVEVGRDVSHDELLQHHHAVVYGVGARADRELGVPGEDLAGVHGAPEVVGWYNGDPDVAASAVDPVSAGRRAVLVGNGNVALDVARLLLSDPDRLAGTDMADHALAALRDSGLREVVLLGRRGPEHAAFTRPELLTMPDGIELVVVDDPATTTALDAAAPGSTAALLAELPRVGPDWHQEPSDAPRIVLAFDRRVTRVVGEDRVSAVELTGPGGNPQTLETGLLVRSTGFRGRALPDLPFDPVTSTVPNDGGRVMGPDGPVPGAYVVGWIKRGATGGIGTNRACAQETVRGILDDATSGRLASPARGPRELASLLRRRSPRLVSRRRMLAIDRAERRRGEAAGRPRVKFTTVDELVGAGSLAGRWRRRSDQA